MEGTRLFHGTTAEAIRAMAAQYKIAYARTSTDIWAQDITRLADDEVNLDEVELLLIALQRAGHISRHESLNLQVKYLRESELKRNNIGIIFKHRNIRRG